MKNKICLIYNFAQHYRSNIFTLLDKELECDFVFGDKMDDVKKMDYSILNHSVNEVRNITIIRKPLYYQKGVLNLINHNYSHYILLGDVFCVSTWIFLIINLLKKKKIYLWTHGWYGKEHFLKKILKKLFFLMADSIFLYGNYAKELMIKEGFPENKLHVIYNSLAYDEQIIIRNKIRPDKLYSDYFGNTNYNLIFIGRLTFVKRLDLLFNAMVELKKKSLILNLTIVGEGEESDKLRSLATELDLSKNIRFYGACYSENELSDLIYNADLCVSPGNVGLTAIHSLTFGTPVITHKNFAYQMPEFEAIVEGLTGAFFKYNDYKSLSNSILNWFSEENDREKIRKNCYDIIDKKYNPHFQIAKIKQVIWQEN